MKTICTVFFSFVILLLIGSVGSANVQTDLNSNDRMSPFSSIQDVFSPSGFDERQGEVYTKLFGGEVFGAAPADPVELAQLTGSNACPYETTPPGCYFNGCICDKSGNNCRATFQCMNYLPPDPDSPAPETTYPPRGR